MLVKAAIEPRDKKHIIRNAARWTDSGVAKRSVESVFVPLTRLSQGISEQTTMRQHHSSTNLKQGCTHPIQNLGTTPTVLSTSSCFFGGRVTTLFDEFKNVSRNSNRGCPMTTPFNNYHQVARSAVACDIANLTDGNLISFEAELKALNSALCSTQPENVTHTSAEVRL